MIKVITYGTYDLLHFGHIRLLERAKALGDYLIVGVTSDDYDKTRGKINNQQSLIERIASVEATGLADEIIVEEYEGQKIDDIKSHNIDIFAIGSDWKGKFDYLSEYCKVVYLERTEGISSSDIRAQKMLTTIECEGSDYNVEKKLISEAKYVNGVSIVRDGGDARYVVTKPENHYQVIRSLLLTGKNVLCESPIAIKEAECKELFDIAKQKGCVLFDGIKTAYSTAFLRMLLLVKSGKIGDVVSIDATCTSMVEFEEDGTIGDKWNSICAWGPTALLPVFLLLGTNYKSKLIVSKLIDKKRKFDGFTKVDFIYEKAVASIKVATRAKSEGELVITGTKGYIYVPSPWWKTEYFEVRFENPKDNQRYFYQLDGEGIRYEIVSFVKSIKTNKNYSNIPNDVSIAISSIIEDFYLGNVIEIN